MENSDVLRLRQVIAENAANMQRYGSSHWSYFLCKALIEDAQEELQRIKEKEKKHKIHIYKQLSLF